MRAGGPGSMLTLPKRDRGAGGMCRYEYGASVGRCPCDGVGFRHGGDWGWHDGRSAGWRLVRMQTRCWLRIVTPHRGNVLQAYTVRKSGWPSRSLAACSVVLVSAGLASRQRVSVTRTRCGWCNSYDFSAERCIGRLWGFLSREIEIEIEISHHNVYKIFTYSHVDGTSSNPHTAHLPHGAADLRIRSEKLSRMQREHPKDQRIPAVEDVRER
ncbi:hypothetical protein BKA63DRAFT_488989 [Paraphoma chrysanthemicola]|nr:hypothetical protein BKA63DRAFT_488989 [Paraphoma chrysanthemicola]